MSGTDDLNAGNPAFTSSSKTREANKRQEVSPVVLLGELNFEEEEVNSVFKERLNKLLPKATSNKQTRKIIIPLRVTNIVHEAFSFKDKIGKRYIS